MLVFLVLSDDGKVFTCGEGTPWVELPPLPAT